MLVLSRKKNESIVINDLITLTVIEIRGDKVRLGIEAPKDVPVHRREVYDAIQAQLRSPDSMEGPLTTEFPPAPPADPNVMRRTDREINGTSPT